ATLGDRLESTNSCAPRPCTDLSITKSVARSRGSAASETDTRWLQFWPSLHLRGNEPPSLTASSCPDTAPAVWAAPAPNTPVRACTDQNGLNDVTRVDQTTVQFTEAIKRPTSIYPAVASPIDQGRTALPPFVMPSRRMCN